MADARPNPDARVAVHTDNAGSGRLIVAVALAASLMPLNSTMVAVALPDIGRQVDANPATLTQALVASYLVTAIALQSPGGRFGDRVGYRRALGLGQLTLAVGAAIGFFSTALAPLAVSRVMMAAGGALVVPSAAALLRTELPLARRGRAFGAFGAVMSAAAALGPVVGGELVRRFGWPSIFLANVPVLAVSALLAWDKRPAPARGRAAAESPRFDWMGSLLLAFALTATVVGLRSTGLVRLVLLGFGVGAFVPFALWERRVADPVLDFTLFKRPIFAAGACLVALQNSAMYALLFELPHVLERLFEMDARATGRHLVAMMATMVIVSPIAGRLCDRFGARPIAMTGTLVSLGAVLSMVMRPLDSPRSLVAPLLALGLGLALASSPAQSAAMSAAPRDKAGMAGGISSTMRYVGGVAGIAALGQIMSGASDAARVRAEHKTALVIFACALAASAICAWLLPGRLSEAES